MMSRIALLNWTPLLVLALLLAGCETTGSRSFGLIEAQRQTIDNVISVEPGLTWNKVRSSKFTGNIEVWTLDGPTLNTLMFFTGVPDGEPLFVRRAVNQKSVEQPPVFKSDMNPFEIQELLEATMARNFQTTIADSRGLRPQLIDQGRGFRFDTSLVGRDEVERHGVFVGTIQRNKLYGAWFQGAKHHYFYRYLGEYDRIIESAQLLIKAESD
ncbi:MAG: hypothetical protein JSU95_07000 [Betaproteobacteria bacterium]|nr:MAG: hypothetical protein JSU95_07000 [Betaproteobacteria bacterium]